jgi:hypothetical protein
MSSARCNRKKKALPERFERNHKGDQGVGGVGARSQNFGEDPISCAKKEPRRLYATSALSFQTEVSSSACFIV